MSTPILTDDRVEAMRRQVMNGVTEDVRRRARRSRWGAGMVAAAAVVVAVGSTTVLTDSSSQTDSIAADSGADSGSQAEPPADARAPELAERQVVHTGSAVVVVKDPRAEAEAIVDRVEKLGGRVDQRSEYGSGQDASASLTLRVPSDRLTRLVDQLALSGEVEEVVLDNDDVTSSAEVVAAEDALTQRQSQLEELTSQRTALGQDVEMATLEVTLAQSEQAADVDPSGFRGGLTRGWNALVDTVNSTVEVAGTVLPWAGLLLLGYGLVRLVVRVRRARTN